LVDPASSRGTLECGLTEWEEKLLFAEALVFNGIEYLQNSKLLLMCCLKNAELAIGNVSSDAAKLICTAVDARFPIVGLRSWHYEAQVLETYFAQLAKQRDAHVREVAMEVDNLPLPGRTQRYNESDRQGLQNYGNTGVDTSTSMDRIQGPYHLP
jgi:hypothetical protein